MFVVVTVLALWLGWELKFIRERQKMRQWLFDHDGAAGTAWDAGMAEDAVKIPVWRRWLGDEPTALVALDDKSAAAHEGRARRLFPEAIILRMSELVPPAAPGPSP